MKQIKATHGHSRGKKRTRAFQIWNGMMQRCYNQNSPAYKDYGARGITVDESWHHFPRFLEEMGEPPENMTLERVNNNDSYSPSNCKWATRQEQARNRRSTRLVTIGHKTQSIAEWAQELGINRQTVHSRLSTNWNIIDALTLPTGSRNPNKVKRREGTT